MKSRFPCLFTVFTCCLILVACDSLINATETNDLDTFKKILKSKKNILDEIENGTNLLVVAAVKGSLDIIRYLVIEQDFNINELDDLGYTAIYRAVEVEQLESVKLLLDLGANTNIINFDNSTLLHIAAKGGSVELIKNLLKYFYIDERNGNKETAAFFAAREGNIEALRFLVENGADPYTRDIYNSTLLHVAARNQQINIVTELITYKGLINSTNVYNKIPLEEAASSRGYSLNVLKELVGAGSDIPDKAIWESVFNQEYDKLRFFVEISGKVNLGVTYDTRDCRESIIMILLNMFIPPYNMIEYLLDQGAGVNIRYCDNVTALHRAAAYNRENTPQILQLLLIRGADINALDKDGLTPLDWAANNQNIVDCLIKFGAKTGKHFIISSLINAAETDDLETFKQILESKKNILGEIDKGTNLLVVAAVKGSLDIIRYLVIEQDFNINELDGLGYTAIYRAVEMEQLESVKLLLELGSLRDINIHFNDSTLLHFAAKGGSVEVMKNLIRYFDIDLRDDNNETATFIAACEGHIDLLRFLLKNGADPYVRDFFKYSLLHTAVRHDQLAVVKELTRYKDMINSTSVFDKLPLDYAVSYFKGYNMAIIHELIDAGSDISDLFIWGAFDNHKYDLLKYLIRKSGKVNVRILTRDMKDCRETLLVVLLKFDNYPMSEFLLEQGAEVNITYCNGETILHRASHYNKNNTLQILEIILDKGADINAKDNDGFTPLDWAEQQGNKSVANFMKDLGAQSGKVTLPSNCNHAGQHNRVL